MRKSFFCVMMLLVSAAGAARAGPPLSMEAFRDAYTAEILKEAPDAKVTPIAPDALSVVLPGKGPVTAYLDNAYAHYRVDPADLREVLANYVGATIATGATTPIEPDRLLILVRPRSYLATQTHGRFGPLLSRPLAGDLIAIVAVDQPTTYAILPASQMRAALRLDDAAIWALALVNTHRMLPPSAFKAPRRPLFMLTTGKGAAASLLVEDEVWDSEAMQAQGAPVVAPVSKDLLLVAHEGDPGSIVALRKAAREVANDPDGLSDQLFVRRNGAWATLPP